MAYATAIAIGGSALLNYFGSKGASGAGTSTSRAQVREARRQYDQTREDFQPFRQSGVAANDRLAYLLGSKGYESGSPIDVESVIRDSVGRAYDNGYRLQSDERGGTDEGEPRQFSRDELIKGAIDNYNLGRYGSDDEALAQFGFDKSSVQQNPDGQFGSLLKKFSNEDLQADPVYQSGLKFGLDQGTGAINARASALGQYDSGATLKALTRYANDYGSTKANESFNRFNTENTNIYNRLAGVSGAGQTATGQVASAGTNASNQVIGALGDAGNARAAGIVGGANAWGNALNAGANAYQNQQYLNLLRGQGNNGGFGTGSQYGNQDYGNYF